MKNQRIFMPGKPKRKLNIRFKFNDAMSEEQDDKVLFRVFDILLDSQNEGKNENNRSSNSPDKT